MAERFRDRALQAIVSLSLLPSDPNILMKKAIIRKKAMNGFFASDSEWKKIRAEGFEGSEWVLLFHLSWTLVYSWCRVSTRVVGAVATRTLNPCKSLL